jgi:hypothetical protein
MASKSWCVYRMLLVLLLESSLGVEELVPMAAEYPRPSVTCGSSLVRLGFAVGILDKLAPPPPPRTTCVAVGRVESLVARLSTVPPVCLS